jgi:uncharacterized protein (DUF488 family)
MRARTKEHRLTSPGTLYTLGYAGLGGADDLRRLLAGTGIDAIVDVRLSPWSGNRAFSSATRRTVEDAGYRYLHEKGLGNLGYKRGTIEIAEIERIEMILAQLRAGHSVGLICACGEPEDCHRWTLAEEAVRRMPGLRVVHLSRTRNPA